MSQKMNQKEQKEKEKEKERELKKNNIYSLFTDSDEEIESISNECIVYESQNKEPPPPIKEKVKFCWADECD